MRTKPQDSPRRAKGPGTSKPVDLEDIEEMRRRVGIDDVELREAIRGLRVGDHVRLTVLAGSNASAGEPLLVRITHIRGKEFRGRLAGGPASRLPPGLQVGDRLAFTAAHIHSLRKGWLPDAP